MEDIERGNRIKARREELHLTQPAVVELVEDAALALPASHPLNPKHEKRNGKAPITLRGYQAWEAGGGIDWEKAKLLASVLHTDAQTLINGPKGPTPAIFSDAADSLAERLADLERRVTEQLEEHARRVEELLERQSRILERIETAIEIEDEAAKRLAADGHAWADETLARYAAASRDPETPAPARKARAKSAIRQG